MQLKIVSSTKKLPHWKQFQYVVLVMSHLLHTNHLISFYSFSSNLLRKQKIKIPQNHFKKSYDCNIAPHSCCVCTELSLSLYLLLNRLITTLYILSEEVKYFKITLLEILTYHNLCWLVCCCCCCCWWWWWLLWWWWWWFCCLEKPLFILSFRSGQRPESIW